MTPIAEAVPVWAPALLLAATVTPVSDWDSGAVDAAALGDGLAEAPADGLADALAGGLADGLADALAGGLADGLADALDGAALADGEGLDCAPAVATVPELELDVAEAVKDVEPTCPEAVA